MATRKKAAPARVEIPHRSADEITEADVKAAQRILEVDYMNDVRSCARDLAERMKDGDVDEFSEALHDAVDGTQRVIYTFQAKLGVVFSSNSDAYFDDFGEEGACDKDGIQWSRIAFMAMERDVTGELERRNVDVNNPRTWEDIDLKEFD